MNPYGQGYNAIQTPFIHPWTLKAIWGIQGWVWRRANTWNDDAGLTARQDLGSVELRCLAPQWVKGVCVLKDLSREES